MTKQAYHLEERLLGYSVRIIKIVEKLPNTRAGNHVAGQLLSYRIKLQSEATSLFDAYSPPLEDSTLDVRCWMFSLFDVVLSSFKTTLYGINVTCDCFGHWILKFEICPSTRSTLRLSTGWLRVVSLSNHL
jgi:hypothetical protein